MRRWVPRYRLRHTILLWGPLAIITFLSVRRSAHGGPLDITEMFLGQLERETSSTRKAVERVPEGKARAVMAQRAKRVIPTEREGSGGMGGARHVATVARSVSAQTMAHGAAHTPPIPPSPNR